jgi:hypothetical protein
MAVKKRSFRERVHLRHLHFANEPQISRPAGASPAALRLLLVCLMLLPIAASTPIKPHTPRNAVEAAFDTMQEKAALGTRHIAIAYDVTEQKNLAAAQEHAARTELFSPGSLMKVPSLLYLLAAGKLDAQYTYRCTGRYYPRGESTLRNELIHEDVREPLPGQWYKCSSIKGHGLLTPAEAIAHSCNHFFMSLHTHFESAGDLHNFAAFCVLYGLEHIARRLTEMAAQGSPLATRDRLHLVLGLPLRTSVYEMTIFFARVLSGDTPYLDAARFLEARQIILEGMRLAASVGTARELGSLEDEAARGAPIAKTGTGLAANSIFTTNGWCVSAWLPTGRDAPEGHTLLFVSFVRESYGAGLPLVCSRYFWSKLFSLSASASLHSRG